MRDLDPNEGDPSMLWAEIIRLREALKGPDGYATWQEAATAERVRRVKAEQAAQAVAPAGNTPYDEGPFTIAQAVALPGVPAGWQIDLDEDASETLKKTIGDDDCVSPITLSICDGHEGRGLYVWLTEYPEEGSLLLSAAPTLPQAAAQEAPAEVAQDAARYRWLRERIYIDPEKHILRISDTYLSRWDGEKVSDQLDRAIDRALAPTVTEEKR